MNLNVIFLICQKSNLMILLIWGMAIILSLCPLVGWSQFVSEVSIELNFK